MKNKVYLFREKRIIRNCIKEYSDYTKYKKFLKNDFHSRCAYCNLLDRLITTPFEIDHFIPYKKYPSHSNLETDYDNLVYSCKKCNGAKSSKHEGDENNNILFYNPVIEDFNEHFCRCNGIIIGNDSKANTQIIEIKLYRPIHRLAWVVERLDNQINKLRDLEKKLTEKGKEEDLKQLISTIYKEYYIWESFFRAVYNVSEKDDAIIEQIF